MSKLLVCIDGSKYADNLCQNAAWVAKALDADIELLHVLRRHSDYEAATEDHSGAIGISARSGLLAELTKLDEERGRLDQKKGQLILDHGVEILKKAGIKAKNIHSHFRRGSLVETISELEADADMVFIGKRGEHADEQSEFLGSNLEKVVRNVEKPVFLVSSNYRAVKRFLIAYDGKTVSKSIEFIEQHPFLKGAECHVLAIENDGHKINLDEASEQLSKAGFKVTRHVEQDKNPDKVIADYVADKDIDLLITGAYSHSRIRNVLLGSTTASLIKTCKVPMILFR